MHDADYVDMAAGKAYTAIVFGQQHKHPIGDWVRSLELIHGVSLSEEMNNLVEYL